MSAAVMKLPTAAPRKVQQRWNKQTRAALKHCAPFPKARTYLARYPWQRQALTVARGIKLMDSSGEAALMIATAMFKLLDPLDQIKVQAYCGMIGASGEPNAIAAVDWLTFAVTASDQERYNIKRALEALESGEAE